MIKNILKRKFILLALLVALLFGGVFSANFFVVSANESEHQSQTILKPLQINNNLHYVNLQGATEFEKFNDGYFLVINSTLHFYNTQDFSLTNFSEYSNASNLTSSNNHLFFVNNNELTILNSKFSKVNITESFNHETEIVMLNSKIEKNTKYEKQIILPTKKFTLTNTNFAINYDKNNLTTTLAFVESNRLNIVLLNKNFNIISESNVSLTDSKPVASITMSDQFVYTFHYAANRLPIILKTDINDLNNQQSFDVETGDVATIKHFYYNNTQMLALLMNKKILFKTANLQTDLLEINATDYVENQLSFVVGEITNIADFKILGKNILILDGLNLSLQQFDITEIENDENNDQQQNTLEVANPKILLASTSYELGRFYNPNHIYASSKNLKIITDTENKRVQVIKTNPQNAQDIVAINDSKIINPIKTQLDNHQNIYVLQNKSATQFTNYELLKYDKNGVFIDVLKFDEQLTITSFSINSLGDIVAINKTDNTIIQINSNLQIINSYEINDATINEHSKILQLFNGQMLVQTENYVYLLEDGTVENLLELSNPILDLTTDFTNNLFVLTSEGIFKYEIKDNSFIADETNNSLIFSEINAQLLTDITLISVDRGTGEIYLFNNHNQQLIVLENPSFSNGLTDFEHSISIYTHPLQTDFISAFKTTETTIVYEYPHYIGKGYELQKNQVVYMMDDYDNQFAMILFKAENSNFITEGYILKDLLQENYIQEQTYDKDLKAMFDIKILTYPTTLLESNHGKTIIEDTIFEGKFLTPISELFVGIDGNKYFAIKHNNAIAYVLNHNLMFADANDNKQEIIKPNKKLFNENNEIFVYGVNADRTVDTTILLDKLSNGKEVFVEKFNKNAEYTLITYVNSDNEQISGFVKTADIKTNNLTQNQISAIIISVASLLILSSVSFVFAYYHKKNKE